MDNFKKKWLTEIDTPTEVPTREEACNWSCGKFPSFVRNVIVQEYVPVADGPDRVTDTEPTFGKA